MTQRLHKPIRWTAMMLLLALPVPMQASDAAEDRIPIVDSELLESMGFAPDAANVYATPEAYARMLMTPDEQAAASAPAAEEAVVSESAPATFGKTSGLSVLHATEFHPVRVTGTTSYGSTGMSERWCDAGPSNHYVGVFHEIPLGARLSNPRVWYYDNSDENITVDLIKSCRTGSNREFTILWTDTSTGTPGYGHIRHSDIVEEVADSFFCTYATRARLGDGSSCAGNQLRIERATLAWQRQVAPAPATARFDDVPPDHLFFQQIEALAVSGITSGCDAESFCPNAPLTRGQMAAFLATALGLGWGD